jgi:hypothetical protein
MIGGKIGNLASWISGIGYSSWVFPAPEIGTTMPIETPARIGRASAYARRVGRGLYSCAGNA